MNAWLLLLVLTGAPGEVPPDGGNGSQTAGGDDGPAYSTTYTPVGMMSGVADMGRVYAETGWPGPPAVCPPGCLGRVCRCLLHKPWRIPPPPCVPPVCPPPRKTAETNREK